MTPLILTPLFLDVLGILAETSSDVDVPGALLLLGPAGGVGFYVAYYLHYRNTDKSHQFERETLIQAKPVTGNDRKINTVRGTKRTRIDGDNVNDYRQRVRRLR